MHICDVILKFDLAYRKVETTHDFFADDKNQRGETYVKSRGLKLIFIGRPHYKEKMLCGLLFIKKKLLRAAIYKKSPHHKQYCINFYDLVSF